MSRRSFTVFLLGVLFVAGCASGVGVPAAGSTTTSAASTTTSMATLAASSSTSSSTRPDVGVVGLGGPWLVFAWAPDSLFLVRPDGTDRHSLDIGVEGEPLAPAWSPDGERIVFVLKDSTWPDGSIWTAAVDGSHAEPFYDGDGECQSTFWPVWSPDGQHLALVCYHDGDPWSSALSILDVATMTRTEIATVEWPEAIDNPPSWSPDGSMLAFDILRWDPTDSFVTDSVVGTIAILGGGLMRLTDPETLGAHPDWSPDGGLLVFNTYDTGNIHGIEEPSNLFTIAPDGTGLHQLTTASVEGTMRLGQPFWSTDGSRIWVSVARDYEKDSTGRNMNTLGWVDSATGELHELGAEGKRFREQPIG